ncbi:YdeI/OmpD-associated family protein [Christensenellaceae bacterium OttesenSCG-928-M15]|nr:YdeI/OmpD-associated family protein [Christensenellaceae bacterium OttesenSCG-928-M15]
MEPVLFGDRAAFRQWLFENGETHEGIWLLFGKKGGPKTVTAPEALEEALCFGWIDGVMKRIDDVSYQKYFARRIPKSIWSQKNKELTQKLIDKNLMMAPGHKAIEDAKENGMWEAEKRTKVTPEQIAVLKDKLVGHEPAYTNFMNMPPSVHRTYAMMYYDAKREETRIKRLETIIDRLNRNLKPM